MSRILVATGVKREAAAIARPGVVVVPGGGDAVSLAAKLTAAADGAHAVLSFGMAGALTGELRVGDWVVATELRGLSDARCDRGWSAALAAGLPGARRGVVHADGRLIGAVAKKRAVAATGAIAVDMESHVAARVATAHGLPFAIVRCISDEADHAMPPALAVAMRADGGIDGAAMLRSLTTRPAQLPAFIATIAVFRRAMRALRTGAAHLDLNMPAASVLQDDPDPAIADAAARV